MSRVDAAIGDPYRARVVHRSMVVDQPGMRPVVKLMFNLASEGNDFEAGVDIAFRASDVGEQTAAGGLRMYTVESVGKVPFEDTIDVTIYVRAHSDGPESSVARRLCALDQGEFVSLYGPFPYPFYTPTGSRSNMVLIGAGCGMVPFRWLARRLQARKLDWMGKVLMVEGSETGLEHLYLNQHGADLDQYFDQATQHAFDALKTRYSAMAFDGVQGRKANMAAFWRLLGMGSVYVYVAGYRAVAAALDDEMSRHLRLAGRWQETKSKLVSEGHWLEYLYD
ncbi:MAG: hypothetical protein WBR56_17590 [Sedimenticolaceae bacterium]